MLLVQGCRAYVRPTPALTLLECRFRVSSATTSFAQAASRVRRPASKACYCTSSRHHSYRNGQIHRHAHRDYGADATLRRTHVGAPRSTPDLLFYVHCVSSVHKDSEGGSIPRCLLRPRRQVSYLAAAPIRRFRRALDRDPSLPALLRSLTIIETNRWHSGSDAFRQLGAVLLLCRRLYHIRLEALHESDSTTLAKSLAYASLWKTNSSISSFTLVVTDGRQLSLLPTQTFEYVAIEVPQNVIMYGLRTWYYRELSPKPRLDRLILAGL